MRFDCQQTSGAEQPQPLGNTKRSDRQQPSGAEQPQPLGNAMRSDRQQTSGAEQPQPLGNAERSEPGGSGHPTAKRTSLLSHPGGNVPSQEDHLI